MAARWHRTAIFIRSIYITISLSECGTCSNQSLHTKMSQGKNMRCSASPVSRRCRSSPVLRSFSRFDFPTSHPIEPFPKVNNWLHSVAKSSGWASASSWQISLLFWIFFVNRLRSIRRSCENRLGNHFVNRPILRFLQTISSIQRCGNWGIMPHAEYLWAFTRTFFIQRMIC